MAIDKIFAAGALSLLAVLAGCVAAPWPPLAAVTPEARKPIAASSEHRIHCRHVAAHAAARGQVWEAAAVARQRYDLAYRRCLAPKEHRPAATARAKNVPGSSSEANLPPSAPLSPGNL